MLAERVAVKYLKSRGYKILYTNWTCYAGELDIVAFRGRLTFVEVKSAFSGLCSPCEMFTERKKKNLVRTIQNFIIKKSLEFENFDDWSLDLVCVYKNGVRFKISHYQNVLNT